MPGHVDDVTTEGIRALLSRDRIRAPPEQPDRHLHAHITAGQAPTKAARSVGGDQGVAGQRFRQGNLPAKPSAPRPKARIRNPVRFSL